MNGTLKEASGVLLSGPGDLVLGMDEDSSLLALLNDTDTETKFSSTNNLRIIFLAGQEHVWYQSVGVRCAIYFQFFIDIIVSNSHCCFLGKNPSLFWENSLLVFTLFQFGWEKGSERKVFLTQTTQLYNLFVEICTPFIQLSIWKYFEDISLLKTNRVTATCILWLNCCSSSIFITDNEILWRRCRHSWHLIRYLTGRDLILFW